MAVTIIRNEVQPEVARSYYAGEQALPLRQTEEGEALSFLAQRPLHTVYMAGLIRDNGVESIFNRGRFYSYRDSQGRLEGIALLGHATLIEAHTESALNAFANLAKESSLPHLIRGEEDVVKRFWNQYGEPGQIVRSISRELLMEQVDVPAGPEVTGLRLATLADLEDVTKVNSEMAQAESGSDPLERDPKGFRYRIARRIALGRNWIWTDGGKLLFKADIIADTPQAIYLEGIYVEPSERDRGYGSMCLAQLGRILLRRTCSLCLTLNASQEKTKNFYINAGYTPRSYYDTIYLQPAQ
ncbi:MAG TPA: GNAT family N-acetyltransferase [Pyrinomonadaceae bacterium]|jgi:predicted GNAT family acetyltransferase|nr:GNAT family N-acetyltransferase [Pyrinomonadaceae bacterium]